MTVESEIRFKGFDGEARGLQDFLSSVLTPISGKPVILEMVPDLSEVDLTKINGTPTILVTYGNEKKAKIPSNVGVVDLSKMDNVSEEKIVELFSEELTRALRKTSSRV